MSTIAERVFSTWRDLNSRSNGQWRKMIEAAGILLPTTSVEEFESAVDKPTRVFRDVPGFEEFDLSGVRAVEPAEPARSLLYHAYSSSDVRAYAGSPLEAFPGLDDIACLENYIYSRANRTHDDLYKIAKKLSGGEEPQTAVVVFAYEYQKAARTVHRKHADLCFSRTGVSRAGTHPAQYSDKDRGWHTFTKNDAPFTIRVIPARYGAFFSVLLHGNKETFGPKYFREPFVEEIGDSARRFWVPLHKLFDGKECIYGDEEINLEFKEHHVNEKLKRLHQEFAKRGLKAETNPGVLNQHPFRITENIANLQKNGSCGLAVLMPVDQPLVQEAQVKNGALVTFEVPPGSSLLASSLKVRPNDDAHFPCPKWVHIRTRVENGKQKDLNQDPLMLNRVLQGGYEALHYIDSTGDGLIKVSVQWKKQKPPVEVPVYSIVAQPDFLPSVAQSDLYDWWEEICPKELKPYSWGKGADPAPLSVSRLGANFQSHKGFDPEDDTLPAVVATPRRRHGRDVLVNPELREHLTTSCLPDDASGNFAPGWDIAVDQKGRLEHMASYGLGSPFAEDARLCAGFGSSWPAAAPDITNWTLQDTHYVVVPLGNQAAGFEGTLVPAPLSRTKRIYDYPNIGYSDWVRQALGPISGFNLLRLKGINLKTYTARLMTMARIYKVLEADTNQARDSYAVSYFAKCGHPEGNLDGARKLAGSTRLDPQNAFEVHVFQETDRSVSPHHFSRLNIKTGKTTVMFASPQAVLIQDATGGWTERW